MCNTHCVFQVDRILYQQHGGKNIWMQKSTDERERERESEENANNYHHSPMKLDIYECYLFSFLNIK